MHTTRPPRTYWGGVSVPMGGSSASCAMQATLGPHIASSPSLLGCKNAQTLRSYLTRGRYPSSARTGVLSCHRHHSIPRARGGLSGPPHMQSILSVLLFLWAKRILKLKMGSANQSPPSIFFLYSRRCLYAIAAVDGYCVKKKRAPARQY